MPVLSMPLPCRLLIGMPVEAWSFRSSVAPAATRVSDAAAARWPNALPVILSVPAFTAIFPGVEKPPVLVANSTMPS
ncbi:MAG TPA: hypothetical protein VN156_10740 [Pseudomonas sp.]|nr:hypothetical protein [Pseudomonas sp.]